MLELSLILTTDDNVSLLFPEITLVFAMFFDFV